MAKPMLSDELWTIIEPLLPPPKVRLRTHPGGKPIDNRRALTGILFVLRSGIPWEYLPKEMGCGTDRYRRKRRCGRSGRACLHLTSSTPGVWQFAVRKS
jgi:transposase